MERRGLETLGRDLEADEAETEGEGRAVQMERLAFGERERGGRQTQRDAGMGTRGKNKVCLGVSSCRLFSRFTHPAPPPL